MNMALDLIPSTAIKEAESIVPGPGKETAEFPRILFAVTNTNLNP